MLRTASWIFLAAATACTGADTAADDNDETPDDESPDTPVGPPPPECDLEVESACNNDASIVQGQVRLGDGMTETKGDLYLALNHESYAGSIGGGYHIFDIIRDVDLSEPVPFALDMCEGGAMWSDMNCSYTLIAILDLDGDQSADDSLPDPGEPTGRATHITLSCMGDSPCVDIVLDCTDGESCASFSDEACACDNQGCSSIATICNL